jgi:hypothetical protein
MRRTTRVEEIAPYNRLLEGTEWVTQREEFELAQGLELACVSIVIGFLPELIFQMQKNKQIEESLSVRLGGLAYSRFDDFVFDPLPQIRQYLVFRFAPPTIAFLLLSAIIQKYYMGNQVLPFLALSGSVSVCLREMPYILKRKTLFRERLLHLGVILAIYLLAALFAILCVFVDMSGLAPSREGLVDGVWSTLFVATIVAIYIGSSRDQNASAEFKYRKNEARASYAVNLYGRLSSEYGEVLENSATRFNCSLGLLYSVVLYEDLNRPKMIRRIENVLVRLPKVRMTVGIAQIRSSSPLTDEQSIELAAERLRDTEGFGLPWVFLQSPKILAALAHYNDSEAYAEQIRDVGVALQGIEGLWQYDDEGLRILEHEGIGIRNVFEGLCGKLRRIAVACRQAFLS